MKILIMIDMQNDFLTGVLGNQQTAAVVPAVCEKVKRYLAENKAPLIYTMDTHAENYLSTQEGRNLPVIHCVKGSYGWQLDDSLKAITDGQPDRTVKIEKGTFGSETLPRCVKDISLKYGEEIEEIELVGVCTDICVISNAMLLKAFFPETLITVDSKCCAGVTPQSHNNALEAMKMCHIRVI